MGIARKPARTVVRTAIATEASASVTKASVCRWTMCPCVNRSVVKITITAVPVASTAGAFGRMCASVTKGTSLSMLIRRAANRWKRSLANGWPRNGWQNVGAAVGMVNAVRASVGATKGMLSRKETRSAVRRYVWNRVGTGPACDRTNVNVSLDLCLSREAQATADRRTTWRGKRTSGVRGAVEMAFVTVTNASVCWGIRRPISILMTVSRFVSDRVSMERAPETIGAIAGTVTERRERTTMPANRSVRRNVSMQIVSLRTSAHVAPGTFLWERAAAPV